MHECSVRFFSQCAIWNTGQRSQRMDKKYSQVIFHCNISTEIHRDIVYCHWIRIACNVKNCESVLKQCDNPLVSFCGAALHETLLCYCYRNKFISIFFCVPDKKVVFLFLAARRVFESANFFLGGTHFCHHISRFNKKKKTEPFSHRQCVVRPCNILRVLNCPLNQSRR